MWRNRIFMGAVLLLPLVVPGVASAALTISFPAPYSFSLSPGSQTVNLSQFNDLGGTLTLTKVTLELNGVIQADVEAENDSLIAGSMGVNLVGVLDGIVNDGTTDLLHASAGVSGSHGPVSVTASTAPVKGGSDYHNFGTLSDSGSDSDVLTSGLAYFIGAGTIPVDVSGNGGFSVSGVTDSTNWVSNFGASGTAKITYEYTPEPATMALFGLGALGLVARRRRSR